MIKLRLAVLPCFALWAIAGIAATAPVHQAVRANDTESLRRLLDGGNATEVNAVTAQAVTALHLAAALNRGEAAQILIRHGADIEARSGGSFSPLHWAARSDSCDVVTALVAAGANVNVRAAHGITPLHWAANRNATNAITLLLEAGADVHQATDSGALALHWAVKKNFLRAAELIADRMVSDELLNPPPAASAYLEAIDGEPKHVHSAFAASIVTDRTTAFVRGDERHNHVLDIGGGEEIELEWIHSLKLWVGKYEVTNGQFRRFRSTHTSLHRDAFDLNGQSQPATRVSWYAAKEFCEWLNRVYLRHLPANVTLRLPLAREWALVARCGDTRTYPWGSALPPSYGNFSDLSAMDALPEWRGISSYRDGLVVSCPVMESGMNEWGIYGMGGNVSEWCEDWYTDERKYKIRKGGSWDFDREPSLRISYIGFDRPDTLDDTIGFRIIGSSDHAGHILDAGD